MTLTLAEALASAAVRIHAVLEALGPQPSRETERDAWNAHTDAVVELDISLKTMAGIFNPPHLERAAPRSILVWLARTYSHSSGKLKSATIHVTHRSGGGVPIFAIDIPVAPDVTAKTVIDMWNAALRTIREEEERKYLKQVAAIDNLAVAGA